MTITATQAILFAFLFAAGGTCFGAAAMALLAKLPQEPDPHREPHGDWPANHTPEALLEWQLRHIDKPWKA